MLSTSCVLTENCFSRKNLPSLNRWVRFFFLLGSECCRNVVFTYAILHLCIERGKYSFARATSVCKWKLPLLLY